MEKKNAKSNNKFLKKWEGTAVKISAQFEHFSVLVLKVKTTVSHSKFRLFKPIFIHLDPESGSGFRIQVQIECGSNWIRIRYTAFRAFPQTVTNQYHCSNGFKSSYTSLNVSWLKFWHLLYVPSKQLVSVYYN